MLGKYDLKSGFSGVECYRLCCVVMPGQKCVTRPSSGEADIITSRSYYIPVTLQIRKHTWNVKRKLWKFRQILPKFYAHQVEMLAWGYCMGIKIVWGGRNRVLYGDLEKYRHVVLMQ